MTILKIGGSLFDLPDLGHRIVHLIDDLRIPQPVLFPGGGALVDQLRKFDSVHLLPVDVSHRLAIQLLSVTAQLLAEMHPRFAVISSLVELHATQPPGQSLAMPAQPPDTPIAHSLDTEHSTLDTTDRIPVLDPAGLPGIDSLPSGWHVTSDSLAAWAAIHFSASRLILCKSVDFPDSADPLPVAIERGLVDPYLQELAPRLAHVEWVNLRSEKPRPVRLCGEESKIP